MSNLFQTVPENFFHPLAAPGKIVYWECIERLFAITSRQLSFGVERDILVEDLTYYFDSRMAAQIEDDADTSAMTSRDKANFILRRLESYGWIYVDVDYSYVQRVNFRDYAVTMIKSLQGIASQQKTEYQGYIYTIYNLARAKESPGIGLLQIVQNTDALITGLKSLSANIKKYIEELTSHQTVKEIMDALLNDYYTNVVDKAYHRLVTSDNVSKFRPEILDRLEADARSPRYLKQAAAEIAEVNEVSLEEAREQVLTSLHEVISAFRQMDEILEDINQKNTKYQGAAIARAKFLLTSSEDVRGQLKNIVCQLAERTQEEKLDLAGIYELEETDRLIRIFSWSFLDMDSLYAPVEGRREFVPQDIAAPEVDEEERRAKRLAMKEKLARILTPAKIQAWVEQCLGEKDRINASQILSDTTNRVRAEAASKAAAASAFTKPAAIPGEGTGTTARAATETTAATGTAATETTVAETTATAASPAPGVKAGTTVPQPDPVMECFIRIIYTRLYGQRKRMSYRVEPQDEVEIDGYRFRDFTIIRKYAIQP